MRRIRFLALLVLVVVTVGSLAASGLHAWYLRSDRYRRYCAAALSDALGLPSDIGRVVPRSLASREFDDVTVWLPGRRDKALSCRQSLVIRSPQPGDPEAYAIELLGGACEISTRTWLQGDYRRVIESGLRPGFDPDGPRQVKFSGMDLRLQHGSFRGSLEDATGVVVFETDERGWAAVHCGALNGYLASQPIALNARFSPRNGGIQVDEVSLRVPELPVSVLALRGLIGTDLRSGTFGGELTYTETGTRRQTSVTGKCHKLSLSECTASLLPVPWRGTGAEIELEELTLENGRPQRLRFRGVLTDVVLGDILAPWDLNTAGGDLVLRVREADLSPAGVERLVASGQCVGLSLEALTGQLGWGRMSGRARLVIDDLTIEQNRLRSLEAELRVEESSDPNWLEGRLLVELINRVLNTDLPPLLPERIEYTQLGFRLDVRDEVLYVFGTHGRRGKTILTARLFEREVPLIREPEEPFELSGWFDELRVREAAYLERLNEVTPERTWEMISNWPPAWWPTTPTGPAAPPKEDRP